jgi:hypothetical protein
MRQLSNFSFCLLFLFLLACSEEEVQLLPNQLKISAQADIDKYCDQYSIWQSNITIECSPELDYSCLKPIKQTNDISVSGVNVDLALQHIQEIGNHGGYGLSITDTDDEELFLPNLQIVNDISLFGTNNFKYIEAPNVVEAQKLILAPLCRSLEKVTGFNEVQDLEMLILYVLAGQEMVLNALQNLETIDVLQLRIEDGSIKLENNSLSSIKEITNYLFILDEAGNFDMSPLLTQLEVLNKVVLQGNISKEQICLYERFYNNAEFELEINSELWSKERFDIFCN